MIANNLFKVIGDFCTNVLFAPYNSIRFIDNWWVQNIVSWIFISITFMAFFYWIRELRKNNQFGNE